MGRRPGETYRRIGVSAFEEHHQLRRDLLIIIAMSKKQSYFPDAVRPYADPPTRSPAGRTASIPITTVAMLDQIG